MEHSFQVDPCAAPSIEDDLRLVAAAALAEAHALIEMSGAKSYEPFLYVERAELARLKGDDYARRRELHEAHRLFLEIGAPIGAEQVAKELAG